MVVTWDVAAANDSKRFAFKGILPVLGLAIALGPGGNVSHAADGTASGTELAEVVVTAQKREQNLQDVPIAVIALSGQQLRDAGVTDLKSTSSGITLDTPRGELQVMDPAAYRLHYGVGKLKGAHDVAVLSDGDVEHSLELRRQRGQRVSRASAASARLVITWAWSPPSVW